MRIDLGCLTGWRGAAGERSGVDLEDVTVEEEIVIAPLPEEGGMICLGVGVGVAAVVEGRGVLLAVEAEVDGSGCCAGCGGLVISSSTGLRMSST